MKHFRFRAQAALELRRREDDAATRVLAQAERQLRQARALLTEVDGRITDARRQLMDGPGGVASLADARWHRSWIVRLDMERRAATERVVAREGAVAAALLARRRTHQRLESLERFREKALDRHEAEGEAAEQKLLDALGTMRYMAARRA